MNKEKIKILLRLYKEDLITVDEFTILLNEDHFFIPVTPVSNWITTQPFINNPLFNVPYYTCETGDVTTNTSRTNSSNIFASPQKSTVSSSFSKKWINSEEPKFDH